MMSLYPLYDAQRRLTVIPDVSIDDPLTSLHTMNGFAYPYMILKIGKLQMSLGNLVLVIFTIEPYVILGAKLLPKHGYSLHFKE